MSRSVWERLEEFENAIPERPVSLLERQQALLEEAEQALELARKEGAEQGRAEGRAEVRATLAAELALVSGLHAELERWQQEQEELLHNLYLTLLITLAENVFQRVVSLDSTALSGLIAGTLRAAASTPLTLKLNPDDLARLQSQQIELDGLRGLSVFADPTLESGSCLLETEAGILDGGVKAQIASADELLRS